MTTHKRLAMMMDLPCKRPRNYEHGICEGSMTRVSAYYTPEYAKRFIQAIMHEMDHNELHEELQGKPNLPGRFGEGPACYCKD